MAPLASVAFSDPFSACLSFCHPVLFMHWTHLLMSWGNYLSSRFIGVLCVTLLLIHMEKHNAETTACNFSLWAFLHPRGLSYFCILKGHGRPSRPTAQWPCSTAAVLTGFGRMELTFTCLAYHGPAYNPEGQKTRRNVPLCSFCMWKWCPWRDWIIAV